MEKVFCFRGIEMSHEDKVRNEVREDFWKNKSTSETLRMKF